MQQQLNKRKIFRKKKIIIEIRIFLLFAAIEWKTFSKIDGINTKCEKKGTNWMLRDNEQALKT